MNPIKPNPMLPLLALMSLLALPPARAAIYYVATNGNDGNHGQTVALPFRTIQRAITVADMVKLHTINVAAGVYAENIIWTNKILALKGAGAGASIVDGGGAGTCLRLTDVPSTASLEGFTIRNGRANNATANSGGGIYNARSALSVKRCRFENNSTLSDGGGVFNQDCPNLTFIACTFANNSCGRDGGGMENWSSSPLLVSCLFVNNSSTNAGGGMDNYNASRPRLIHCTFSGNRARTTSGGAISNSDGQGPSLTNCILWGNAGGEIIGVATVAYSDVQGGYAGTGNLNADPSFVSAVNGDFRLRAGSPCLDAASAAVPGLSATDLDGVARIQGSAPDMGAYEFGSWFVDQAAGHDTNPGNLSAPFATVTKAVTVAGNGNQVFIKQGHYGSDQLRITKSLRLFNWGNAGQARIGQP
jgi:predicted outer membrane repeat protein